MEKKNKFLIVIVGPTAVGKTELCIKLANTLNTEIVSADSRQFFMETELGTAKPNADELSRATHHLVNTKSIHENYDVGEFEKDALSALEDIFSKKNTAILTGGSGLYINVVCEGMDEMPEIPSEIRQGVISDYSSFGLEYLQEQIKVLDPEYYRTVDIKNPQRLMRALEVFRGTGRPFSSYRIKQKKERPFHVVKVALMRDREELYRRIEKRMDNMVEQGLFEEAEKLFPLRFLNALQTVGYTEIFGFLEGKYDREEAIRLLKRNSRRYAKRQLTWFRKDPTYNWFHPEQFDEILDYIKGQINP
ncbi:tRNA (adenosine(37)-N6)-dimethylallyltransferase MiaA [Arthrospiribacter ruber]|uniref:tRNA dimethylallyltransferase n=1 Tax=Arthrospiribacter ruber TaxID=2487934 RepID=A0A951MGW3_9BACT|nr:tRNA (adenosine(37)-N6)-dimethylallyltransferase MiaA [Arthrospiribacter ruber]MBW3469660.1 tRNA (adenosine(37)-N6)-dimethylallyltransferase MiaA [Arthrospiribacter ruber]